MTIDRFDKTRFERELVHAAHHFGLTVRAGTTDSEYTYRLPMKDQVYIQVRSSVSPDTDLADKSGQDSIRLYLCHSTRGILSRGDTVYTNRLPGWEGRLLDKIGLLVYWWTKAGCCPKCGQPNRIYKVIKRGPNFGKYFVKCDAEVSRGDGHTWKWID